MQIFRFGKLFLEQFIGSCLWFVLYNCTVHCRWWNAWRGLSEAAYWLQDVDECCVWWTMGQRSALFGADEHWQALVSQNWSVIAATWYARHPGNYPFYVIGSCSLSDYNRCLILYWSHSPSHTIMMNFWSLLIYLFWKIRNRVFYFIFYGFYVYWETFS